MKHQNIILAAIMALTLSACGNDAPAPEKSKPAASPQAAAPAPAPTPVASGGEGEKIYKKVCALCHSSGVAGAPIPGNHGDWDARIAQGNDVLYKHAIEGFTGEKGMMPPRGGGSSLTDDEVKAGVDYMVGKLK